MCCSYYYSYCMWQWPSALWPEQRSRVSLSMLQTGFPWKAATCLTELLFSSTAVGAFLFSGGAGWFSGLGCSHQGPQPPSVCVGNTDILHLEISHVFFFFLNSPGPACPNFPKNVACCFLFRYCSSSLFLPVTHSKMYCLILIKRVPYLL